MHRAHDTDKPLRGPKRGARQGQEVHVREYFARPRVLCVEKVNMRPHHCKKKNGRSTDTKVSSAAPALQVAPHQARRLPLVCPLFQRGELTVQRCSCLGPGTNPNIGQPYTKLENTLPVGQKAKAPTRNGAAHSQGKTNGTQPSPWPFVPAGTTAQCTPSEDVRAFERTGGRTPSYCSIPCSVPAPYLR